LEWWNHSGMMTSQYHLEIQITSPPPQSEDLAPVLRGSTRIRRIMWLCSETGCSQFSSGNSAHQFIKSVTGIATVESR
jgi:hypothetical protein